MLDNKTVVETAAKVFEKYNLPDGAQIDGRYGQVSIWYVFDVEDTKDMEQVLHATNEWKKTSGRWYLVDHRTEIDGVPVRINAQIHQEAYVGN